MKTKFRISSWSGPGRQGSPSFSLRSMLPWAQAQRRVRLAAMVASLGTPLFSQQALAQTSYYWDTNDTSSGSGPATGTWGTDIFWNSDSTGSLSPSVTATTQADDLFFSAGVEGTDGTITVDGTQLAHSITFDDPVALTISGGTAINIGNATVGSGIFVTNAGTSVNTITTGVTIDSSATAIAVSNAGTGLLTVGTITGSAISGTQAVNIGSSSTGGITLNGIIANGAGGGNVALTVNNTGTGVTTIGSPTLSTPNTFTGGLTLSGGTLSLGTGSPLGTGTFTLSGGAINPLNTSTPLTLTNNLFVTAATTTDIISDGIRDVVYPGTVSGSGTLKINSGISRSVWLQGDGSAFTGTIDFTNLNDGVNLRFAGTGTSSNSLSSLNYSNAKLLLSGSTVNNRAVAWNGANGGTLRIGSLSGTGLIGGGQGNGFFLEVGNLNESTTFSGSLTVGAGTGGSGSVQNNRRVGLIKVGTGTLTLNGSNTHTRGTTVRSGTLGLATGSSIAHSTNNFRSLIVGDTASTNAIVNVTGGTLTDSANQNGSIQIGTGTSSGVLNISAGSVSVGTGNQSQIWVGGNNGGGGFGALNISGGSATIGAFFPVGFGTNDRGVLNQTGGTITVSNFFMALGVNATSLGVANLSGGTYNSLGSGGHGLRVGENGPGILTVSGTAQVNAGTAANSTGVNIATAGVASGILNLNGGTITTRQITKGAGSGSAVLNFGGGTLKANAANTTFISGLNNTYINAGGATIDSNGFAVTIPQALLAPTGDGVSATGLTVSGGGYIATPQVVVTGGGGTGATAVATIDGSGNLTGITITNPGVNYTSAPAFSLFGGGAGNTGAISGTATLAANTSGGLSKVGPGTLTLSGTNTYAGMTTVDGTGTLVVNGSLAVASTVTVASTATLGGTGTINGSVTCDGTIAPGTPGTTAAALGTLNIGVPTFSATSTIAAQIDSTTAFANPASSADKLAVTGALNIAAAAQLNLSDIGSTVLAPGTQLVILTYTGAWNSTPFSGKGDDTTITVGSNVFVINYNDTAEGKNAITLTSTISDPYLTWAGVGGFGLIGADALKGADPDKDGASNLLEFATNSDPTSGSNGPRVYPAMVNIGAENVLTYTLAVRKGNLSAFVSPASPDEEKKTATRDKVKYTVEATNDLGDWSTVVVTEVTDVGEITNVQTVLGGKITTPTIGSDWEWKTFRTDGGAGTDPSDFMRLKVEEAP